MAASPWFRDRLLGDPLLPFKLAVEVGLDVGLACFAEGKRPQEEAEAEREFFVADLLAGSAMDAALVLAVAQPAFLTRVGALAASGALRPAHALARGAPFRLASRARALLLTSLRFGAVGAIAGGVGQAGANVAHSLRRRAAARAGAGAPPPAAAGAAGASDAPPPPHVTALVYGLFAATSGAARYTLVAGLDAAVWAFPATRVAAGALPAVITTAARFASNVIGGEQFVDIAAVRGLGFVRTQCSG